jgi:hypothetical protein
VRACGHRSLDLGVATPSLSGRCWLAGPLLTKASRWIATRLRRLTQGAYTADLSGYGRNGLVGAMPTVRNQLQYSTQRASQRPRMPSQLPSTAPFIVSGAPLVLPIVDGANTLGLRAADPTSDTLTLAIDTLPTLGTLTHPTSGAALQVGESFSLSRASHQLANSTLFVLEVVYTPSGYSGGWSNDSFNYSATVTRRTEPSRSQSVHMPHPARTASPPPLPSGRMAGEQR